MEEQAPIYKAQLDPNVPLSWLADDETGGYMSNFILSRSDGGLPDGNFVIAKTYGANKMVPFNIPGSSEGGNRIYYTLMFITKDGEVLQMGDRELTLQVTGTLGYAQYLAGLYKRQMQEGKPYQLAYNKKTLEEYLLTLPEDKRILERVMNSSAALVKFFDFNPLQKTMEILSIPKTVYMNLQIALARAIGGREQGWVENAGFADYSREASQTYGGADIAAQLKEAGFLGNVALGYLDMVSDPMFWIGGGFGIRAGLRARASATPGTMENSWARLGVGYSRDFKGLYSRYKGEMPDEVLYSNNKTFYEKMPDEAFETQTKTGTTKAGETGGVGEDIFARTLAGDEGAENIFQSTPELETHINYVDPSVPRNRGIGGAHNREEFFKNDVQIAKTIPSKDIPGATYYEYYMPRLGRDGKPSGGYGTTVFEKTVYDPRVFPESEYMRRGLEAANDSYWANGSRLGNSWEGFDSYGVKWKGYARDGMPTSFFPDIPKQ